MFIDSDKLLEYISIQLDDMLEARKHRYNAELEGAVHAFKMIQSQIRLMQSIFDPEHPEWQASCCSVHSGTQEECKD